MKNRSSYQGRERYAMTAQEKRGKFSRAAIATQFNHLRSPLLWIGVALMALSITAMSGWITHRAALVQVGPGFVGMVFNSAVAFCAIGLVIVLAVVAEGRFVALRSIVGGLLLFLSGCVMLQYATGLDFQIDWKDLHNWLDDTNPNPGRIAVNSGIGFMLCGAVLVLIGQKPKKLNSACIHFSILLIMLAGLTGLVGYTLRIDLIYPSLHWPRMAVQVAVAFILTALALWIVWYRSNTANIHYRFQEDEKIGFLGGAILSVIALTIGVAGLSAQVAILERTLSEKMWPILQNRHAIIMTSIHHGVDNAERASKRIRVAGLVGRLMRQPQDADALTQLQAIAGNMVEFGFSGVAFYDAKNRRLAQAGKFADQPELTADLAMPIPASLLWDDTFYLKLKIKLFHDGQLVGIFVSEQPMTDIATEFFNLLYMGKTGESGMCFDAGESGFSCFPQPQKPAAFHVSARDMNGNPTAMSLAIAGREGFLRGLDYLNHNVVAVYRPVTAGLGLVVKQDASELFQPVRDQIAWALPLIFLLGGVGAFLLYSRVTPIATQLIQSRKAADEKEQHTSAIIDNMVEGIITVDDQGSVRSFGGGAPAIFGYLPQEVIGRDVQMLLSPEMRSLDRADIASYLHHVTERKIVELAAMHKNGTPFQTEFAISTLAPDGRTLFVLVVRDITERKRADAMLFAEKERLRVTLSSIDDAVITTDIAGCVTYLNPKAESMTRWRNEEAQGKLLSTVFQLTDRQSEDDGATVIEQILNEEKTAVFPKNTVLINRDGERFAIEESVARIQDRSGKILGAVLVFHDVSEAHKMAEKMSYQAKHDDLTGLVNRREFVRRLRRSLRAEKIRPREHTLLYIDLDRFKIVNDTCGHTAGDELLRQISALLQIQLRQSDTLARIGGDEFCVLLEACDTVSGVRIAETLLRVMENFRFVWKGRNFPVGGSIGLVSFCETDLTVSDILRMADTACYVAKEKGRNRIQVYSQEDNVLAQRQGEVKWVELIRQAIDHDRLVLYAQRILPLKSADAAHEHYEILVRLLDDGKLIPPMAFIPAAERYGLMPDIDRWVIEAAFSNYVEFAAGNESAPVYAINLSGASLGDENFLTFVLLQFDKYAVPARNICFEITETSAIANLSHAVVLIRKLKAIGCSFSLDDFGCGMSSFSYLKHLPVDYLKIDGSFVKDMVRDPIDRAMVESINNIGHVMGIKTIAEFVENDAILMILHEIGVNFAQGYGIAKPALLRDVSQTRATI